MDEDEDVSVEKKRKKEGERIREMKKEGYKVKVPENINCHHEKDQRGLLNFGRSKSWFALHCTSDKRVRDSLVKVLIFGS